MEKINKLDKWIFIFLLLYAGSSSIISLAETFSTLALLLWLFKLIKNRGKGIYFTPLDLPILGYIIIRVISTYSGIDPVYSFRKLKEILLFSMIYIAAYNFDRKSFKTAILVMIYANAIIVIARIIHMYWILGYYFGLEHRLSGFSGSYMRYGTILSICILLAISIMLFSRVKKVHRILMIPALLIFFIGLGMTMTRSSWVGLGAGLFVLGLFKHRYMIYILMVTFVMGVLLSPPQIKTRLASFLSRKDATFYQREVMWSWGLKVFKDHPVFGIGPGNVKKLRYAWREYPVEESVQDHMVHLHSNFMQVLVTLGITGSLAFTWLVLAMFSVLIRSVKAYARHPVFNGITWGILTAFIAFIVTGLFEYNFFNSEITMIIFFLTGGSIAINLQKKDEEAV